MNVLLFFSYIHEKCFANFSLSTIAEGTMRNVPIQILSKKKKSDTASLLVTGDKFENNLKVMSEKVVALEEKNT